MLRSFVVAKLSLIIIKHIEIKRNRQSYIKRHSRFIAVPWCIVTYMQMLPS